MIARKGDTWQISPAKVRLVRFHPLADPACRNPTVSDRDVDKDWQRNAHKKSPYFEKLVPRVDVQGLQQLHYLRLIDHRF